MINPAAHIEQALQSHRGAHGMVARFGGESWCRASRSRPLSCNATSCAKPCRTWLSDCRAFDLRAPITLYAAKRNGRNRVEGGIGA